MYTKLRKRLVRATNGKSVQVERFICKTRAFNLNEALLLPKFKELFTLPHELKKNTFTLHELRWIERK